MNWKELVKPVIKFGIKFGLNYLMERSAGKVAEKPEKGAQIAGDVAALGELVVADSKAIADGKYDETEKAASDAKVESLIDRIFAY